LPYQASCDALFEAHRKCFEQWSYEIEHHYSICLYGYGSKRELIMSFAEHESDKSGDPFLVINGYHPHLDTRQILRTLSTALDPSQSTASIDINNILHALTISSRKRLLLAFHNIDGPNLRTDKAQSLIAQLVRHEKVRLICSIDHVNAPRLWSFQRTSALRLIFHDATTFEPYTLETEFQANSVFASSTKGVASLTGDRGVKWILQTLSTNALTLFKILLRRQVENNSALKGDKREADARMVGMESRALFEDASRVFAVSNRTAFTSQLQEFLDHEIIVSNDKGILRVPFGHEQCARLLQDLEDGNDDDDDDDNDDDV
jgi:origin recognition complex subunit 2